jgi:hypothetical protein
MDGTEGKDQIKGLLGKRTMTKSLYSLREAVAEFFGDAGVTVSTLRTEHNRGKLDFVRLGNRDYVHRDDIERMVEQCRIRRNPQGSGLESARGENPSGQSVSERARLAQAALSTITQELKKPSRGGSLRTKGRTPVNVISIKSR